MIPLIYQHTAILVRFLHTIYICFHICSSYFGYISLVWSDIKQILQLINTLWF